MRTFLCGATLAIALMGNAAAQEFHPLVHALPITIDDPEQERTTAESGPVILRQLVTYFAFAHIDAPLHIEDGNRSYDVNPDDLLFVARIPASKEIVFCSSGDNYRGRGFFGQQVRSPVCLIDAEAADGTFDVVQQVTPSGGPFSTRYGGAHFNLQTPVHYTLSSDAETPFRMQLLIKFVPRPTSNGELHVMFMHNGAEEELARMQFGIPPTLPYLSNIEGARIEVIGVDEDGLRYRLRTGLDTVRPHEINIEHSGVSAPDVPSP